MSDFLNVDWSKIPEPTGFPLNHVVGRKIPSVVLPSSNGEVNFSTLYGLNVLFFYPMTARPGIPLPLGWDAIPGARGCTPQVCSYRDYKSELFLRGVNGVYGISSQSEDWILEAVDRLSLSFPLVSDRGLEFSKFLGLPVMVVEGMILYKRLTLIVEGMVVKKVFFPVFPPDRNVHDVISYLDGCI
ncbi:MAG: peroxiredoxin [Lautropia sp.]|nr:peroxiredoxin [Lautropia sp.]